MNKMNTFLLEDYYGKYEFNTRYMLSSSDPESWSLDEVLAMGTDQERDMWHNQRFGYTEVKGAFFLRETIARMLYSPLSADNILCFAGAQEGIFCALLTLCSSQDHVVVIQPCYQSLQEMPRFVGAEVTALFLQEANQWHIDIDAIKNALKQNTKIVIINFPHNPTGQIITQAELSALIALLKERDIWLFSDEVYRLLGPEQTEWAQPAAVLYDKALSLGVMSKAYGLPGLRIGWIACQNKEILAAIEKTKHYTSLCNSGPAEIISAIALRNQAALLARNNSIAAHNLALLDTFFSKYSALFSWVRPQGGCTGFVRYKGAGTIEDFCTRLREQASVLLLPGSVYQATDPYFRIGFGRKNMPEALALFEKFIEQEKDRVV